MIDETVTEEEILRKYTVEPTASANTEGNINTTTTSNTTQIVEPTNAGGVSNNTIIDRSRG